MQRIMSVCRDLLASSRNKAQRDRKYIGMFIKITIDLRKVNRYFFMQKSDPFCRNPKPRIFAVVYLESLR